MRWRGSASQRKTSGVSRAARVFAELGLSRPNKLGLGTQAVRESRTHGFTNSRIHELTGSRIHGPHSGVRRAARVIAELGAPGHWVCTIPTSIPRCEGSGAPALFVEITNSRAHEFTDSRIHWFTNSRTRQGTRDQGNKGPSKREYEGLRDFDTKIFDVRDALDFRVYAPGTSNPGKRKGMSKEDGLVLFSCPTSIVRFLRG